MTRRLGGTFGKAGGMRRIPVDQIAIAPPAPLTDLELRYQAYALAQKRADKRVLAPANWLRSIARKTQLLSKAGWDHPPLPKAPKAPRPVKQPKKAKAAKPQENDYQKRLRKPRFGEFPTLEPARSK